MGGREGGLVVVMVVVVAVGDGNVGIDGGVVMVVLVGDGDVDLVMGAFVWMFIEWKGSGHGARWDVIG